MITYQDFEKVDIRVGRIVQVDDFPEAKKPAYKLTIDFGAEIGIKKSSAQINQYNKSDLLNKQVLAVVNFPPKQIGPFISEVLTLGLPGTSLSVPGLPDAAGNVILIGPDEEVPIGGKLF